MSNKLLKTLIMISISAVVLIGCGEDDKGDVSSEKSVESEESIAKDELSDASESISEEASSSENTDYKTNSANATQCTKAYQAFLNGREDVCFDYFTEDGENNSPVWYLEGLNESPAPGKSYTLSGFVEEICKATEEYYDERNVKPRSIKYSFIDCGNDGIPELALLFEEVAGEYSGDNYIILIKLVDDKLQCIFQGTYSYRSYASINEYGIYCYGGSNGAASHVDQVSYIDGNGNYTFLYGCETLMSAYGLYLPNNDKPSEIAEEEGITDRIEIEQYYFDTFEYVDEKSYDEFMKACDYVYYPMSENFNRLEGQEAQEQRDGAYARFWESTGLKPAITEEEINKKIDEVYEKAGVTKEILNGSDVDWLSMSQDELDVILEFAAANEPDVLKVENPSWNYYYFGYEPEPATWVSLEEIHKAANEITDVDIWFNKLDMEQPDRFLFNDDLFYYNLYGEDSDGMIWYPYMMDISDVNYNEKMYTLDFTDYYIPDEIAAGDESFVEESIHWATSDNGILYVSTYHQTYASYAPHNGYITAFDMNDNFKVLWRTEPLTCNSNNFVVTDDAIICGYGFTAEDDYVYVLDKECGLRVGEYKVKTGPDWFELIDDNLYVRCYDTDYIFKVKGL